VKLRPLPIIITLLLSSTLLFGGWFVYRGVAMENPLTQIVNDLDHVTLRHIAITKEQVKLELEIRPDASLREIYRQIAEKGAQTIGNRRLDIRVVNDSSEKLEQVWATALFDIAQAMETKQYTEIPKTMERLERENPGLTAFSEMDDHNVYIRLTLGEHSKHVILPRIPITIGVWPNEQI
jgi:hypothetical protein